MGVFRAHFLSLDLTLWIISKNKQTFSGFKKNHLFIEENRCFHCDMETREDNYSESKIKMSCQLNSGNSKSEKLGIL